MSDVNVSIGVSLRELQQGLGQAGELVKDFKEQASRARGAAMFLADGIKAIGGASNAAAGLAGNLLGGFAMGGPMGLAIGGVNALIAHFKESGAAAEEAAKKAKEAAEKIAKAYKDAALEIQAANFKARGFDPAELALARQRDEANDRALQIRKDRIAEETRLAELQAQEDSGRAYAGLAVEIAVSQEKVRTLKAQEDEQLAGARTYEEQRKKLATTTAIEIENQEAALRRQGTADAQAEAEKQAAAVRAAQDKTLQYEKQGKTPLEQLEIDHAANVERIESELVKAKEEKRWGLVTILNQQLNAELKAYERQKNKLIEDMAKKEADDSSARRELENLGAFYDNVREFKAEIDDAIEQQKLLDDAFMRTKAVADTVGMSVGQMFGSVITGQASAGQAMRGFLAQMVQMLINMSIAQLIAHMLGKPPKIAEATAQAGLVGAGTAAALASNPVTALGAIPAGVAAMQAAMAAFVPIAAASGGFDIGNYNPVTQLHAREMVLPASLAEKVRNMTDQPGGTINFTIHAVDAKSVEQLLQDNQGAVIRTLQSAARNGRF